MKNDEFWGLIERSRGPGGDSDYAQRLTNLLQVLPAVEVSDFYKNFLNIRRKLHSSDLMVLGMLLNGGYCGDDSFEDFCNWLISRGREFYEMALSNIDSLADAQLDDVDGEPAAMFEEYGYVAPKVYRTISGNDISTAPNIDLRTDSGFADSSTYQLPTDEILAKNYPMLWKRFGRAKQEHDASVQRLLAMSKMGQASEANIPGLGHVRVGSVLRQNGSSKRGTIQQLFIEHGDPMAKVMFEGRTYPATMLLSEEYFSIESF